MNTFLRYFLLYRWYCNACYCGRPTRRSQQWSWCQRSARAGPARCGSASAGPGSQWSRRYCVLLLWPTHWTTTAMNLVSVVSKCRPSQVWSSKRRTGQTERRPWRQSLLNNTLLFRSMSPQSPSTSSTSDLPPLLPYPPTTHHSTPRAGPDLDSTS